MTDLVLTERHDGGVAVLRLNRPPMNPLSVALLDALRDAANALAADPEVKAVVVAGSEKAFAAGADITELRDQAGARASADAFRGRVRRGRVDSPAGDRRDPRLRARRRVRARAHVRPACRVGERAPRAAGDPARRAPRRGRDAAPGPADRPRAAKELVWSGRQIRADEAQALGILDRVVASTEVEENALHWAAQLGKGAVVAMGLAKRVIDDGLGRPLAEGLDAEADAFVEAFGTDDAKVGVASFLEHGPGKATFSGR